MHCFWYHCEWNFLCCPWNPYYSNTYIHLHMHVYMCTYIYILNILITIFRVILISPRVVYVFKLINPHSHLYHLKSIVCTRFCSCTLYTFGQIYNKCVWFVIIIGRLFSPLWNLCAPPLFICIFLSKSLETAKLYCLNCFAFPSTSTFIQLKPYCT